MTFSPDPRMVDPDDVHSRLTNCIGARTELQLALQRLIESVPYHPACTTIDGVPPARCSLHVARDEAVETIRRVSRARA